MHSDIGGRGESFHIHSSSGAIAAPPPIGMPAVTSSNPSAEYASFNKLRIVCFNVRGLQCNRLYTQTLLQDIDILEHWLHNYNLKSICDLDMNFKFLAAAPPDIENNVYCIPHLVRGHGGVAIGWRSDLDSHFYCAPHTFPTNGWH